MEKKEEKLSVRYLSKESGVYVGEEVHVDVEVDAIKIWFEREDRKEGDERKGKRTGRTIVVIRRGDERFIGMSDCSKKDQFCRKKGSMIAMNRAKYELGVTDKIIKSKNGAKGRKNCCTYTLADNDREHDLKMCEGVPEWMMYEKEKTE